MRLGPVQLLKKDPCLSASKIMGLFLSTPQFGGQQNGVSNVCCTLKYLRLICVIVWKGQVASTVTSGVISSQVVKKELPMSGQLMLYSRKCQVILDR